MSERSEFGPRAPLAERRRCAIRGVRIGSGPGGNGFGDFCQDKSHPRDSAEALFLILICLKQSRQQSKAKLSVATRPSSFLMDQKGTKKSFRRTRSGPA